MYAYPCNMHCSGCGHPVMEIPRAPFVKGELPQIRGRCINPECEQYNVLYEVPVIMVPAVKIERKVPDAQS